MSQRDRFYPKAIIAHVKTYSFIFLVLSALTLSGCGASNFNNPPDEDDAVQDPKANETIVREHWKTISEVNVLSQGVTFTSTETGSKDVLNGQTDSISVDLSLIADAADTITGSGEINLASDVSSTSNAMSLGFESADVNLTEDTLTVTGSAHIITKMETGSIVQPACEYTLVVTRSGSDFFVDVTMGIKDLRTTATFKVPFFRTADEDPLSFITQTWSKQSPGIQVHFPRKRYSTQKVSGGLSENTLLEFRLGSTPDITGVTGLLHIPSTLSANGDDILIDIGTTAYIFEEKKLESTDSKTETEYINKGQHTVTFQQSGTLTTLDIDNKDTETAYSLSVTVSAKNVFITSPNPAYPSTDPDNPVPDIQVDGVKTEYTALVSLILKDLKNDTGISGEQEVTVRTTLRTTIDRTDYLTEVYDENKNPVIPSFTNGSFVLEGGTTYNLTHATSVTDIARSTVDDVEMVTPSGDITEDIVKTTANHVQLDLAFSGTSNNPTVSGSLVLDKEACPSGSPGLSVDLSGLPVTRTDNDGSVSFTIGKPEPVPVNILKHLWKGENCPKVSGFLSLSIHQADDGTTVCDVEISSTDLVTAVKFTAAIVSTSGGVAVPSAWTLSKNMFHSVYSIANGMLQTDEVDDGNIMMNVVLGYRINHGTVSIKASGSVYLDCEFMKGYLLFEDSGISVAENGQDIVIEGLWQYLNGSSPTSNIGIELKENNSGDREFDVALMLPDEAGNPLGLVSFSVLAEKTDETRDLLSVLLNSENDGAEQQ